MQKKQFVKPHRMNIFKMSLEEIDSTNKVMEKELKKLKIPLNGVSGAKGKSPSSRRNINLSPVNGGNNNKLLTTSNQTRTNSSDKTLQDVNNITIEGNTELNKSTDVNIPKFGTFEYKLVKKDKLLIPATEKINMKNLKLCQKNLLPKEKNYFVSEKNFQLIADAINAKEIDIKNLKILLDMAHQDLNAQNDKFQGMIKMNEIFLNKNKQLAQDNANLKLSYDDLMFQINKMNTLFARIVKLIKYILLISDNDKKDKIKDKINEFGLNGIFNIDENNTDLQNNINKFFTEKELQNEQLCREYKKKYYDAQNMVDQLSLEAKNNNLSDIAKDMLETKKRIKELNEQNEKLEHENTYLRISYQNLYCENEGKNKSNLTQVSLLNSKIKEISQRNGELSNEIMILKSKNEELEESLESIKSDMTTKTSLINDLSNKNSNIANTLKDKENIITELKRQIIDLTKKNTLLNQSNKIESRDDLSEYLNKSSDDLYFNGNKAKASGNNQKGEDQLNNNNKDIAKKDMEIQILKEKIGNLQNEDKNLYFEGDSDAIGVNGVQYIGDMFMILYNQAKMIEGLVQENPKLKNRKINSQMN